MRPPSEAPPPSADPEDRAHWEAVEEASELLHERRFRETLVELREVVQRDANNPYALYFMGIAFYESGQIEPSRDAYRACLRVAPRHLGARVALIHVLRALGDVRAAIEEGGLAMAQAPGDADVLYAVGMAHFARGDEVAARRFFHAFLAAGPEFESSEEVKALLEEMGDRPS